MGRLLVTPNSDESAIRLTYLNVRSTGQTNANSKETYMLYTLAVVLIVLWLLGLVSGYAIGGFIHILLVVAIIMILVNLISGRRRLL
jgi:hypothetical protein